ncbi:cysteine--tRNA ligase [Thiomicrospira sp. R3]|uniref:cysteine--tRNA ligase n=1 Tax=Thiomicrospira sp. R3 TaxID=3035472 RepID=UPI00259AF414|nr:cysteine--tRNA ligase [Thiomicrospira sp. R3]WFE68423.1 cysteine--tRNA ligase [Thiomicrospira sp. R3]
MNLHIYNTETRQKDAFKPIVPGKVGMYVCGVTVYDYCHIGHARVMVVFDTVVRHMRALGLEVKYVRNITDIDDKIINRAFENQESVQSLTERFISAMHEDETALNILRPDIEPKATDFIPEIQQLVKTLIDKGHAYAADNGDVYFKVKSFDSYGRLSGKKQDELEAGARVEVNPHKQDPMDFVLWKASKANEPAWDSAWGQGRPGWHIECSAMSGSCIGERLDIHGGGMDLQFPHHENEIAQSESAHGEHYVNTWMHVGFVRVDNEKMSKSLNNFFTIREVLKDYHPEVIRYFLLSSHYRSPLNYTIENLDIAKTNLARLYTALQASEPGLVAEGTEFEAKFNEAMDDDFNTPQAMAVLFELIKEVNKTQQPGLVALLQSLANRLGLLTETPEAFFKNQVGQAQGLSDQAIADLIAQRTQARTDKNWARSDEIRDELLAQGIELLDSKERTTWRRI